MSKDDLHKKWSIPFKKFFNIYFLYFRPSCNKSSIKPKAHYAGLHKRAFNVKRKHQMKKRWRRPNSTLSYLGDSCCII